jgi:hypothetical protein
MSQNCEIGFSNRGQDNEFKVAQYFVLLCAARSCSLEITLTSYVKGCPTRCFLDTFAKLRLATVSFVMYIRLSAWNNSAPTGQIFMKFDTYEFFENLSRKPKFH